MLEINFGESDYSTAEGSTDLSITLQFRNNQNAFTITLTPVEIDAPETVGLEMFLNSDDITSETRATAGNLPPQMHNHNNTRGLYRAVLTLFLYHIYTTTMQNTFTTCCL